MLTMIQPIHFAVLLEVSAMKCDPALQSLIAVAARIAMTYCITDSGLSRTWEFQFAVLISASPWEFENSSLGGVLISAISLGEFEGPVFGVGAQQPKTGPRELTIP